MKGVVFTEFLEMVESKFSADMVDDIIAGANLPDGGAYTAVGTYPHAELGRLVAQLSKMTGLRIPELLKTYGRYLFGRFYLGFPQFFAEAHESFEFLERIEKFIHVEVRKLYPDAELPTFETLRLAPDHLRMIYRSPRCLGDFAQGLMEACFDHFKEKVEIVRGDESDGAIVRFDLQRLSV